MPHSATVTASLGPGRSAIATALTNISRLNISFDERKLQIAQAGVGNPVREFEMTAISTITITNSSGNYTVTIA